MPLDGNPQDFEPQITPDVFSRKALISWLRTQDLATEYNYEDPRTCLMCRYLTGIGKGTRISVSDNRATIDGVPHFFSLELKGIVHGERDYLTLATSHLWRVWTYGAALQRAEALA